MMPVTAQPSGRRITIALEASETGRPALVACARLAAMLGAELEGIFIEDINLIRLAGLSFLREVRPASLGEESLDVLRMQRELRALARAAERMLAQAAQESGVPWTFRVWRGHSGAAALNDQLATEFLGLIRTSRRAALRMWATGGPRAVAPQRPVPGICVMTGAPELSRQALLTAGQLAQALDTPLTVLLTDRNGQNTLRMQARVRELLAEQQPELRFLRTGDSARELAGAVLASRAGLLVAQTDHPLFRQAGLDNCLEALPCPALLVR